MPNRGNDPVQGQKAGVQQTSVESNSHRLAEMFHDNMSISDKAVHDCGNEYKTAAPPVQTRHEQTSTKYSMSQHYTHSSHVAQNLHPLQPSKQDVASRTLIKSGIPPSSLLRSQLALFEGADEDQRKRLIELWQIVPPTYARNGGQEMADRLGEYQSTTLVQEEEFARLRYLREARAAHTSSQRSEVVLQPIPGYQSSAPGQSLEGNRS